MSTLKFIPIPTEHARAIQRGELDSNGQMPERRAEGGGPCRHCLKPIEPNEEMLIIGYRPFPKPQPYAEIGPIFLHASECTPYEDVSNLPPMFNQIGDSLMIVRGYDHDNRIIYDAAAVITIDELAPCCEKLLSKSKVVYLHIRFAATNCYQFRVESGSSYIDK